MESAKERKRRIDKEIRAAGVRAFNVRRSAVRYLRELIHPDEHIMGIVYGRYTEGPAVFGMFEGMLVATDRRVLFIDRKPGFVRTDDITYEAISSIQMARAGPFSAVAVYTNRVYALRFARNNCAVRFTDYVERRLEAGERELLRYERGEQ